MLNTKRLTGTSQTAIHIVKAYSYWTAVNILQLPLAAKSAKIAKVFYFVFIGIEVY